jgi:hypothetical protein
LSSRITAWPLGSQAAGQRATRLPEPWRWASSNGYSYGYGYGYSYSYSYSSDHSSNHSTTVPR